MRLGAGQWFVVVAFCVSCGGKDRAFGNLGNGGADTGSRGSQDAGMGGDTESSRGGSDEQAGVSGAAESSGECVDGAGVPCEFGCSKGICNPDPCLSVTCDEPGVCRLGPGQCNATTGTCDYQTAPEHTVCGSSQECIDGTCQCSLTSCPAGCCSLAGECGACTPTTLATRMVDIQTLTISSPLLYFLEGYAEGDPEVYSLSTLGGEPQNISVPPPGDSTLSTIVADRSYIYGASFTYNKVGRMPTTGGSFVNIAGGETYLAQRLLTNEANVFTGFGLSSNIINVFPKKGGTATKLVDSLTADFVHFAVDESFVYFISSGQTALNRIAATGASPAEAIMAADAGEKLVDVAVAGDQVVFVSSTRVAKVDATGGKAFTLDVGAAYALLTDETDVFYVRAKANSKTCASGSEIFGVPLAGGPIRRVAIESSKSCIRSIVQDTGAIYWLADKVIRKVGK